MCRALGSASFRSVLWIRIWNYLQDMDPESDPEKISSDPDPGTQI
jgi:hypothetical protein